MIACCLLSGHAVATPENQTPHLDIDGAVRAGQKSALQVRLAESEFRRARSRVEAARASTQPRIEAGTSINYTDAEFGAQFPAIRGTTTNADAVLSLPLDISGVNRARVASALALLRSAEADQRRARNEVAFEVRNAYLTALRNDALLAVATAAERLAEEQVSASRKQLAEDEIASVDLRRLESLLSQRGAELASARASSRNGRFALARILGVSPNSLGSLEDPKWHMPKIRDGKLLVSLALRQRPEIVAQAAVAESASEAARAERAAVRPNLSFQATHQRNLDGPAGLNPVQQTLIGLSLRFPLRDGGSSKAAAGLAEEEKAQALIRLRQIETDIAAEVEMALSDLRAAVERTALAESQLTAAREVARGAMLRRREGLGTVIEVVDAESQLRQAEENAAVARFDALLSIAALERSIGGELGEGEEHENK